MVREGGIGVQIMPEVWRTMKAIFSGVMSLADIIRSPSFSREVESRTMMNSPFLKAAMVSSIVSNSWMISEEGILIVYGNMWWVKGNERVGLRRCDEYIYICIYKSAPLPNDSGEMS